MAPKKMNKAIVAAKEEQAPEKVEVVYKEEQAESKDIIVKKKRDSKKKTEESSGEEDAATSNSDSEKKKRKPTVEKVLELLKKGEVEKATAALEVIVGDKKEKKPREPSAFNKFVKEKMAELKDSRLTTKEKMSKCAELWRESKN